MFKKLISLIVPCVFVVSGFADEAKKVTPPAPPAPIDVPVVDNFYNPDKNVDGPIPHPSDVK